MRAPIAADVTRNTGARRLASTALLLSASIMLSRVLGLVRNLVIADVFGDTRQVEAYFAAFRIPDTMFTLVSGGALASAFIPVFAGLLAQGREDEAWKVASTVFNTVAIALGVLALCAFILAPVIMGVLTGGYTPGERALTVDLTRIMLLQPIFLGAAAIMSAVLQSYHRFLLTALAPLVYNLVAVIGALLSHSFGVGGLAWSVVLAAAAQVVIQAPGLARGVRRRFGFALNFDLLATREILRLFTPRVIGLAAFQAMLVITLFLASRLPHGAVGAVTYSFLLVSFPIGALGTATATAVFPHLAELNVADDYAAIRRTLNQSLRLILFIALPAAVGLIVLRRPIINLLYGHGVWTERDTELTAFALLFYAMALAQLSVIELLPRVFYALKDTRTPVRIAVVTVAADAALSILFVHLLPAASGQGGLALATAIATTIQALWLGAALERRLGGIGRHSIFGAVRDAGIASLAMGAVLYVLLDPLTVVFAQHGIGALITVAFEITVGVSIFSWIAYLLGAPELWQVRNLVQRGK